MSMNQPATSVLTHHSSLTTHHFFTPRKWAGWLAGCGGILDAWLAGGTVLDPTCGRVDLLLGLLAAAIGRGQTPRELPIERLFGIEREPAHLRELVDDC